MCYLAGCVLPLNGLQGLAGLLQPSNAVELGFRTENKEGDGKVRMEGELIIGENSGWHRQERAAGAVGEISER